MIGTELERVGPEVTRVVVVILPYLQVVADPAVPPWIETDEALDDVAEALLVSHDGSKIDAVVDQRRSGRAAHIAPAMDSNERMTKGRCRVLQVVGSSPPCN